MSTRVLSAGDDAHERAAGGTHLILWTSAAMLVIALAWAAWASVDVVVSGEGRVIPSSRLQVVQNLEGGIVAEIMTRLGATVERDQPLMRIDATRFEASFKEGKAKDVALLARIARLDAEANGKPFNAPATLLQGFPKLVREERELFDRRARELAASHDVLNRQAEQRRQELSEKRSREFQLRASLELAQRELQLTRPLLRQGVVSEVEVLRLERQVNDIKGDLDASSLALPRLEAAHREIQQKLAESIARFRAEASKELNLVRAEQSAVSAANEGLEDRVVRTVVRAPVAGTINAIKVNTIGGVVQAGQDLIEIVPAEESLLIEARVKPADIAFLRPGQESIVKITAYDYAIYGSFPAVLELIGADAIVPDKPNERPESYYPIRVRTKDRKLMHRGETLQILPGMVAVVDVKTGRRTVLEYLIRPVTRAKETALRER